MTLFLQIAATGLLLIMLGCLIAALAPNPWDEGPTLTAKLWLAVILIGCFVVAVRLIFGLPVYLPI